MNPILKSVFIVVFACQMFIFGPVTGQVEFVNRVDVPLSWEAENFITVPHNGQTISLRVVDDRVENKSYLEYFTTNEHLNASELNQVPLKPGSKLLGFDIDEGHLAVLCKQGKAPNPRVAYRINYSSHQVEEIDLGNVLEMELHDFFALGRQLVFMGVKDQLPVVQILNLSSGHVTTAETIYANEATVLQMRKLATADGFDLLVNKMDRISGQSLYLMTYDLEGEKLQEVKLDSDDSQGAEIIKGLMPSVTGTEQVLVGPYGDKGDYRNKGFYFTRINEFGEYKHQYLGWEAFSNFNNYLSGKEKEKQVKLFHKAKNQKKELALPHAMGIREVIHHNGLYLVYTDHYEHRRGLPLRDTHHVKSPGEELPIGLRNQLFPGGYPWFYSSNAALASSLSFTYLAAHFALLNAKGEVMWDNSISLDKATSPNPYQFGEVSFDGENLYFINQKSGKLAVSHLSNGDVVFSNRAIDFEHTLEEVSVGETLDESITINPWKPGSFLVSGKQRIHFINDMGEKDQKEVYFLSELVVQNALGAPLAEK